MTFDCVSLSLPGLKGRDVYLMTPDYFVIVRFGYSCMGRDNKMIAWVASTMGNLRMGKTWHSN